MSDVNSSAPHFPAQGLPGGAPEQAAAATPYCPFYAVTCALAVVSLPFTKALTLDLGFPLKAYEFLFALSILSYVGESTRRFERFSLLLRILFLFWTACAISSVVGAFLDSGVANQNFRGG